jgi:arylsulfatase A-like enzyme
MKLLPFSFFISFLCLSCQTDFKSAEVQPNFILFLVDDFGYADISYEGNTQIKTPSIDRIAENGARFTRFYQSGAACAPTRASLLTGRYHLETGVWGVHAGRDFMHRDETTIANVFHDAGYVTGAFGKWHSGKTWRYFSWNRGFDVGIHSRLYRYFDTEVIYNNKIIHVEGPITDVLGDQVVKFIEENRDKPFFAYVPFQSIHEPYNCPPEIFRKYKEAGYTDHVARLYGMIEVMDVNIGKILDELDQLGLTENTVILFLSDDGPSPGFDLSYGNRRMNEKEKAERRRAWPRELRGGKGSIWEGGSITPFYIQWEGKIPAGMECSELSGVIDIFPTVLEMAGINNMDTGLPVHGKSFWPLLKDKKPADWDERRYFDNTNFYLIQRYEIDMKKPQMHHIALHYQQYKLVRADNTLYGGPDSVYYFMYDLLTDPVEENNILEEKPEIAAQLIPEIETWYQNVLEGGRAFHQAVYEIGNWEETITPINLDAVLELKGSVRRSDNSTFRYDNWIVPGSAMLFEIDVKEDGYYQVELGYSCDPSRLGSFFRAYTQYDTAIIRIDHPSSALSDTLLLPPGRQVLQLELVSLGRGDAGVDVLNHILVHRIPGTAETYVLKNTGMKVFTGDDNQRTFHFSSATADFMFGNRQEKPLEVLPGEEVTILPFADNEDQIQQIELFVGFDRMEIITKPPFLFSFTPENRGRFTINMEFTSGKRITHSVHGDILVK